MSRAWFNSKGPTGSVGAGGVAVTRIGPLRLQAASLAWGLSLALHGGVLTTWYFVAWSPQPASMPELLLAQGEQAASPTITLLTAEAPKEDREANQVLPPTQTIEAPAKVVEVVEAEPFPEIQITPALVEIVIATPAPVQSTIEMSRPDRETTDDTAARETIDERTTAVDEEATASPLQEPPAPVDTTLDAKEKPVDPPPQDEAEPTSAARPGVETGAEIIDLPIPKYPRLSRKRGEKGLVVLEVEVRRDGSVGHIKVVADAGYSRLTQAAIAAVRKARFKPATRDDTPVRSTIRIPLRFVLKR